MSGAFVIDTSALLQAYIQDAYTPNVLALLTSLLEGDAPALHFCEMGLVESTNVLWKHVQRENVTLEDAYNLLQNLLELPLFIHPTAPYLPHALLIAHKHTLAVYDSLYVALALALDSPLITADGKQERVALTVGVNIQPLTDFTPKS